MVWQTKKALRRELDDLRRENTKVREFVTDVLSWRAGEALDADAANGNPYRSRERLVAELVLKYKGYARWGNQLVQRIVDTRAAFALGRGVRVVGDDGAELDFARGFIRDNKLDGGFASQLAVEKELEGQVLLRIYPAGDDGRILVSFVSWNDTHYDATFADGAYRDLERVEWKDPVTGEIVSLGSDEAVFMRFNAPANCREGVPSLSGLLVECEDVDRALRDWRKINNFFASPTPYFRTADMSEARDLYERLTDSTFNWRIGKVFTGPAEFSLVGMDAAGVESIRSEIETKVKVVAGGAGVPVQFLGFPEFMTNRSTAENSMEPVEAVAMQERQTWTAGFSELLDKAIAMRNEYASPDAAPLKRNSVAAKIPFASARQIETLAKLYLPAFQAGALDHKSFIALLPESDQ